ncbi:Putative esterase/acetyl hydrolase [Mycobacteroides abscessus subsp. massiliense]|nr:Putative esterase/acetyl hydrolase [Mycobacteroides abscessus subsp. massiliense]SLE13408.1 Putative esterase/acetyl hydrolase [Mycobacteroides abscessus subsp. massiliense]
MGTFIRPPAGTSTWPLTRGPHQRKAGWLIVISVSSDWDPSLTSYLIATSARGVLRPLTQALPSNQYGLAVMDRVLRAALIASRPRPGLRVRLVDTVFAGDRVRGDWVVAPNVNPDGPPILYIHGGAFSMCSPKTHRGLLGELSAASLRPVFAVRYRLAPRYPYPAAADDALRAYRWLAGSEESTSARTVAIAGCQRQSKTDQESAAHWSVFTCRRHRRFGGRPTGGRDLVGCTRTSPAVA